MDEAELRGHAERARVGFEAFRQAFRAAFSKKEREAGVEAAFQILGDALRRPLTDLLSRAEAYEAAFLLASLFGDSSEGKRIPKDYTPLLPAMTAQIRAALLDPTGDSELQRALLARLSGVRHEFHFEVRKVGSEGGVPVYDFAMPVDVFLLTDAPLLTTGPAPKASPGAPALAEALWTVAQNQAVSPLVRAGAILALGQSGADGPRDALLQLAGDGDSDVRRAAVYLLTLRKEPLTAPEFLSVLESQHDPVGRSLTIRGLGAPLVGDPRVRDALVRQAVAPVPPGGVTVPQYAERRAALITLLEGFAGKRDRESLEALAPHVDRWAGEVWKSTSPLVLLAEEASRLGLKEFLPYLRAAAPQVPAPDDRRRVEEAIAALGP